ncbi:heme ABC transporter permease [Alphaproteobacteria bacterium]|nr:heme ABC transporter permease [Alphaproteobacteria bacterium]MDB2478572.1 heme ABC transporter permease [Alphaproteobacteria bacterium]MDB2584545.1 heme ABC transporter permease [Alphaproteobacteria bacterium]MDC0969550.1 heme ABC transporter permease [Alphaproteobacteria bacterium]MDC1035235.1 heme ABC transporter permease [Alphaproteobacteria bacterium]
MFNWLANPNRFSKLTGNLQLPLIILSTTMILLGLYYGLFDSPEDYQQGDAVRIMYVHVPSAWLASFLFFSLAISCIFYLVWKHPLADLISNAIAPIGAIFSVLTLVTGSLWGKPMWGTWWVWDARLTSMLILFFFYLGYMLLSNAFERKIDGSKSASVLAIIGLINLPIIKFSVDWWHTLHQPSSILRMDGPSIDKEMLLPLTLMMVGFSLFSIYLIITNVKTMLLEKKCEALILKLNLKEFS